MMDTKQTILLVDMNAFFACVEQQCDPTLRGKPVLVGGSPGTRSVVAAASYEARKYGIHSAMPIMEALERCPDAIIISGNLEKYADVSRRIVRIFMDFAEQVEIYSIDECFIDVTSTMHLFGGAVNLAKEIKRRIKSEIGLTCSVGIGPNKLLAKLAAGMQKPDGLTEIKPEEVRNLLENLPIEKLHGIGGKTTINLNNLGIRTAGELGRFSRERLKKRFGIVGEVLHDMGNGIDHSPIVPYHSQPDVKSMGHSYTMARNTCNLSIVKRHLLRLSEMVGRRLREQHYAGKTVTLVIRYSDMHTFSRQKSISDYIDDGLDIYNTAVSILESRVDNKRAIRLIGVSVSGLAKGMHQMQLFSDPKQRELLNAMDEINNKYGEFTVRRASLLDVKARPKTHGFSGKPMPHEL